MNLFDGAVLMEQSFRFGMVKLQPKAAGCARGDTGCFRFGMVKLQLLMIII